MMKRSLLVFLTLILLGASIYLTSLTALAEPTGSGPDTAITIGGVMTGTLKVNDTRWYQFSGDGSNPAGVIMSFIPNNQTLASNVYFNVDWSIADGQANADWPGLFRVGQGTPSGLPAGQRYWFASATKMTTYYIQVVNTSDQPVGYALQLTGAAFPPPTVVAPAPGAPVAMATPAGPPLPATPAVPPTPTAFPTPSTVNTATDRSGLILAPKVLVSGPFSTVQVNVTSDNPNEVVISRLRIQPPAGAVVDGVNPSQSINQNGVLWFPTTLVGIGTPFSGYEVRMWGSANGTVVEVDWSTSTDNGALLLTIENAPAPAPIGAGSF